MESLAESKIETWMAGKEEVQLVDMVLRIRAKLSEATSQHLPLPDIVKESLQRHIDTIIRTLPSDLQVVLEKGAVLNVDKNYNDASRDRQNSNNSESTPDLNSNKNNEPKESIVITSGIENINSPDIPKPKDNQTAELLLNKATTPT